MFSESVANGKKGPCGLSVSYPVSKAIEYETSFKIVV